MQHLMSGWMRQAALALANAMALLFTFCIVYAIVGTHLFRERSPIYFGNLAASMFTLSQVITADGCANDPAAPTSRLSSPFLSSPLPSPPLRFPLLSSLIAYPPSAHLVAATAPPPHLTATLSAPRVQSLRAHAVRL